MDSKASTKATKKSQNFSRKKKRHRKSRESAGRGIDQSPGVGKVATGREGEAPRQRSMLRGSGAKDSGGDTDSRDSGLEGGRLSFF